VSLLETSKKSWKVDKLTLATVMKKKSIAHVIVVQIPTEPLLQ